MATLKFYDDFTAPLALWISPQTGGTWHAPDTWEESGTAVNASWWIDPLYPATNQADANPFSVSNSILNINLIKTPADVPASAVGNQPYISGKLVTNHRFQTTYGYFEARIKMPHTNGFMGAFWLNPHDGAGWPPEIDITEMVSNGPTITTFAVWSNDYGSPPTNHGGFFDTRTTDLTTSFHYYAVNWQADFITWYLDGQQLFQQPTPSDCHQDFYIILSNNVGRSTDWGGAPDSATQFPGQMQVDYVAVWDVSPYAGGGGGTGAGLNLGSGGTGTASKDGTVVFKGDGTFITDANNHVWGINVSAQVTVDGTADTSTANVTELAYVTGSVSQFSTGQNIPFITPGNGSITDANGHVWTITASPDDWVVEDGVRTNGGGGTAAVEYYQGTIYAQDGGGTGWYTYDGTNWNFATATLPAPSVAGWSKKTLPTDTWTSGTNPLSNVAYTSASNSTVVLGSTSKLIDSAGNAYGLVNTSGGEVVANGTADTSVTGISEIAYAGGNIWRFQSSSGLWWFETSPAGPWQPTGGTGTSPLPSVTTKRAPSDQPFSNTSVWNIGIGSGATWGAATDTDVKQLVALTGNVLAATNGQPAFLGAPSDPLVTITCTDATFPVPNQFVHVPLGSVPSAGADGWMNFFDLSQPTRLWSYAGCKLTNGADVTGGITAAKGGVWDCSGDGVANAINPGSDYNFLVGTVTDYDLQIGAIQHALRFSLGVNTLKSPGATWTANIPWPGTHEDLNGPTAYTGQITYGCTIGIPASVILPSLTRGGTWLATALQRYGAICRIGTAANSSLNFYTTPGNDQNQNILDMRSDLPKLIPLLNIMRNQGPSSINGGGSYPILLPQVDTNPTWYQPMFRRTGTQTWNNFRRPIQDTKVVVTGLPPGTQHDFEVVSFNARGSLTSSLVTDSTSSGSVTITGINLSNSTISAGAPVGTVVGIISVSMSSGSFSGTVTVGGTSSLAVQGINLVTTAVVAQGNYPFTLTASQAGLSSFTQTETLVANGAVPGPPTNVTSPSQSSTQVVLSWSAPTIGAKLDTGAYQVQYKTTQSGVWLNGPIVPYCTPGVGSFTDSFGNAWSLNPSNNPVANGNTDTVSHAAILLIVGGVVWQQDTAANWYSIQPTGTITSAPSNWSAPTTVSPLTDVVASGLSASTAYNFQVFVSNSAGNGPAASSTPASISTQAASSTGPTATSNFIAADFASPMQWPIGGGGQATIDRRLWGVSSSTLANGNFAAWADTNVQAALSVVNPSWYYLVNGGFSYWDSNLQVIPSVVANMVNNFYKCDPLGISGVIMGADFNLNGLRSGNATTFDYGTAMGNLASYLFGATMPNGKKFPLIGMTGHNEPDNFGEATVVNYYNDMGPKVKAVSSSLLIMGPSTSARLWGDFPTQVSTLDVYAYDTFTGFVDGSARDPFNVSNITTQGFGVPTRYGDDANASSTSLTRKPLAISNAGWGPAVGAGDDSVAMDNSYLGCIFMGNRLIQGADNSYVPYWGGKWGGIDNGEYGVATWSNQNGYSTWPNSNPSGYWGFDGVTTKVTPKGYMMARCVRNVFGPRWNVPTNSTGMQTCAVTSAAGKFAIMVVNSPGTGNKSGTVALSHAPVGGSSSLNSSGTGPVNVWQVTTAQTLPGMDGATSTVQVTNGVTSVMSFPDTSVTIISV